jgi:hypothetical protein
MTPAARTIRDRRQALGLKLSDLAWAARVRAGQVTQPDDPALARLDAALAVLEAGGSLEDARCGASGEAVLRPEPGKRGPRAKVSCENVQITRLVAPGWPAHDVDEHLPDGPCFRDVATRDYGSAPMRPATGVLQATSLGN